MSGECVLVVDDAAENVDFIVKYVLKPHGYVSLVAGDGAEGLHKALTENPDLILLDMQMPKMTGVQVLEALDERRCQIPVILMTVHGSEQLAVRVFRLGVRDYVIKPFDVEELLAAVGRALAEVRLRQERDDLLDRLMAVNRQLEQRVRELDELEHLKDEFVSTVSHDLRSPLTSIRGFADLIEMAGPLNDQQRAFAEKIRKGVAAITTLIEDLLDLERIETGAAFEFEPLSVSEVIAESVDALRGQMASRNQWLDVHVPSALPSVLGNRMRLKQAVSNLVSNAIKYTPDRGHIRIWAEAGDEQLLVCVQDTGIGISVEDQAKLFQKFYRVRRKETEEIPGTGLGLAIAKSIVEMHGGRVWVDSTLDKGSTFTFLLPLYKPR